VTDQKRPEGAFILWKWGDREIEDPKILKRQLLEIVSRDFSGVLVTLGPTRYEFIDRKVLRAVAQVSQWAKKRHITFWLQADPRQASRTFITKTGERTQNLIVARKPKDGLSRGRVNIARVTKNRFKLRYQFPRMHHSPVLQELSLCFEPSGLEKAFLFQKENGVMLKDSIRDITPVCHFFTNIAKGITEVFGNIRIPEDEEWWVVAFPKFDTNLYDYAGRESNDLLNLFVEDLFDACTHLDGISFGEGGAGYVADLGRFPVSLSLYNCFRAEYGYDLRDNLYGLVLEVDDASHIHIRYDYYTLLMDTVLGAQKDFHQMIHSFFRGVDFGLHYTGYSETQPSIGLVQGKIDPWRSLEIINSPFTDIGHKKTLEQHLPSFISALAITKSLGVFSETQRAFFSLSCVNYSEEQFAYLTDLMALYSVHWLSNNHGDTGFMGKKIPEKAEDTPGPAGQTSKTINHKIHRIGRITEFRFPVANTLFIYPTETIMAIGSQDAEEVILSVNRLIEKLVIEGFQLDVVSSVLLKEGRLSNEGLRIREQIYDSVIFPYPEVLDPKVLDIVSSMDKFGVPILLGGCKPRFTTTGKRIPHVLPLTFDPLEEDLSSLLQGGVRLLFTPPENSLTTLIRQGEENLFLICPNKLGDIVEGKIQYGEISFSVPRSSGLIIFRQEKTGKAEQIY
jgi:hypothetical protein